MNLLTAWVIFTFLFWHGTQPLGISNEPSSESYLIPNLAFLQAEGFATGEIKPGVRVQEVLSGSLAEKIGLQAGMVIMQVNEEKVMMESLTTVLASLPTDKEHTLSITSQQGSESRLFSC
jgi:S1-C subfamily serine protease